MVQSIETSVRQFRKVGTPSTQKDWLTVISALIPLPNEAIEEFLRQARIHGVDWLVRTADALLSEVAVGNTYRDEANVLRLRKTPEHGALREIMHG
jgi:hypothetical protein